jgi:hypothetical protein
MLFRKMLASASIVKCESKIIETRLSLQVVDDPCILPMRA